MLIADSQVHIWTSGTPVHIHRQVSHYTKDELLKDMNEAGVDRVLLHPPSWDPIANEVATPQHFGESSLTGPAPDLHLEEPILRRHVPLREEDVVRGTGVDVRHAPPIATHLDRAVESR